MAALLASIHARRWAAACVITISLLTIQVGLATRSSSDNAAPTQPERVPAVPTAAMLVPVNGTVTMVSGNLVGVTESAGAAAVGFTFDVGTLVTRDGATAEMAALNPGDQVSMTVDARTGHIVHVRSEAPGHQWQRWLNIAGPLASLALAASLMMVIVRHWNLTPDLRLALAQLPLPTIGSFRKRVSRVNDASIDASRATSHSCGTA